MTCPPPRPPSSGLSGVRETRSAGAAGPASLFALASLTKPLVAMAVMVAAEEGSIDLDAPVAEHLAAYRTPAKRAITPRHLLSHASGLPEVGPTRRRPRWTWNRCARPPPGASTPTRGTRCWARCWPQTTGIGHADVRPRGRVRSRSGWTRSWACPSRSRAGRSTCASPACGGRGRRSSTRARGGSGRPRRAARLRRAPPTPRFVQVLLQRGAPLIAAETFDEFAARAVPRPARRDRVVRDLGRADWGAGVRHPRRQGAALDGDAHLGRDAVAFRRLRHADVGRSRRRAWASSASPTAAPTRAG